MHGRSIQKMLAVGTACLALGIPALSTAQGQPDRVDGKPNLNGVWQAIGSAHWNIEGHSATALPDFWQLGAIGAIPAGRSVVEGGTIPYLPAALEQREANRAAWPASDPEAKCYQPGIPRATYMPYPFRIVQGIGDILFAYEFASANRVVHMEGFVPSPIDSYMGWSNGHWDGDTLVVEVSDFNGLTWFDRAGNHHSDELMVTERYTLAGPDHIDYEATIEDPLTFSRPWRISMPLYRRVEDHAQLLEYKCIEFAEELLYGHLRKVEDD